MKKFLITALALSAALASLLIVVTAGGNEGHASGQNQIASVFGVKESSDGDLIVHISTFVPAGVDSQVVAAAALKAQNARPATPADFESADFTTTGLVWDQFGDANAGNDFVTQYYNPSNEPNGVNGQTALTNTHDTWNAVASSAFTFSFGGSTTRCPSLVNECSGPQTLDGFNDVTFMNLAGPCNPAFGCTLGVTWYTTTIDEADMALNTRAKWVHDCNYAGNSFEAETVILHENGHVAGLGHSPTVGSVMGTPYDGTQCQLHQDDIDGIAALYPASGATATPTPAPTATPIPTATPAPTATPIPTATPAPTATPVPGSTASVSNIGYSTIGGRFGENHLNVTINVVDDGGQPVDGASVSTDLDLDGGSYSSKSGTTGPDGSVTFKFTNAPAGCYDTAITDVTAAGLLWDDITPSNGFAKGGATC